MRSLNISIKENQSATDFLDKLLKEATALRASDIHIDPTENKLRVRLRIDGILYDVADVPVSRQSEIISRIKILSSLRIDEHNAAQDGRFRFFSDDKNPVDVRVSILPTYYGENAILRLLSDKQDVLDLDNLGFGENDIQKIRKAITKTGGMILVTGPTGSGKTTTLYAILKALNKKDVSIVTIEEPIEYAISGIRQIQVNSRGGLTFGSGLRSILRQDPNIIMVGEIRDRETASLATNAALTGHLLLSTLHTNDASSTMPRLIDMGVEPFLLASTFNLAINQRLVRRICSNCKTPRQKISFVFSPDYLKNWSEKTFFYGKGCKECNFTGYRGRLVINEILSTSEEIKDAILKKQSAHQVKKSAQNEGFETLLEDGLAKVSKGLTSLEEVLRVIHD